MGVGDFGGEDDAEADGVGGGLGAGAVVAPITADSI